MAIFSLRAECQADVNNFLMECDLAGLAVTSHLTSSSHYPDVEVEFQTSTTLENLRNVVRRVVDGHVMLQTLRDCPLSKNSLERDYDLSISDSTSMSNF